MANKWSIKKIFVAIPSLLAAALITYISYVFVIMFMPDMFAVSLISYFHPSRKTTAPG
jgi:hypothetical protein